MPDIIFQHYKPAIFHFVSMSDLGDKVSTDTVRPYLIITHSYLL